MLLRYVNIISDTTVSDIRYRLKIKTLLHTQWKYKQNSQVGKGKDKTDGENSNKKRGDVIEILHYRNFIFVEQHM